MSDPLPAAGTNPPADQLPDTYMSLGDHIQELRKYMLRAIYGLLIACGVCLFFGNDIIAFIATPLLLVLQVNGFEASLRELTPGETFFTYLRVSLISGLFLASPWVFWQLWQFVAAGLYRHEKRMVVLFAPFSALLFICGGLFFIFIVAPFFFHYFLSCNAKLVRPDLNNINPITRSIVNAIVKTAPVPAGSPVAGNDAPESPDAKNSFVTPTYSLQFFVNMVTKLALAFTLVFQTPLVLYFLGRLGIVSRAWLQRNRKYALFIICIISAVLTPADPFSMIAMAIPMYLLYEIGILLLYFKPRKVRS